MKNLMKYFVGLMVVVAIAGVVGYFYQGVKVTETKRKIEQLVKEEVNREDSIIVGLDPSFPPMTFVDAKGKVVGFDIDIIHAVAKSVGKKLIFKEIVLKDREKELNEGNVDMVMSGTYVTEARKSIFSFTKPYIKDRSIALVTAESPIVSVGDLGAEVVGVQAGTPHVKLMKDFVSAKGKRLREVKDSYNDAPAALVAMLQGDNDVVVLDEVVGRYYKSRTPGTFRVLEGKPFAEFDVAAVVKKGNEKLVTLLNKGLDAINADGTYKKIHTKWFGN